MNYLVESPLPNVDDGERFESTDSQFEKTKHSLWFTTFKKISKCKQCGLVTTISRHGPQARRALGQFFGCHLGGDSGGW
jgi:hypothetical protein